MQREQIDNLIVRLIVIKEFSKDIHYTCHGEGFYGKHLLVDKFNFDDSIDLLKECCLLGNDERPLSSRKYLEMAYIYLATPETKDDTANFNKLLGYINNALFLIKSLTNLTKADENVIGGIAQDLQQYKGLINLQIEE